MLAGRPCSSFARPPTAAVLPEPMVVISLIERPLGYHEFDLVISLGADATAVTAGSRLDCAISLCRGHDVGTRDLLEPFACPVTWLSSSSPAKRPAARPRFVEGIAVAVV